MCALLELGAAEVVGVEIEAPRVVRGNEILAAGGLTDRATLLHVPDTTRLPLADSSVDFVLCNAVLEHIPGSRAPYIREMWRVLKPGGYLFVNETPNKYLPLDYHTTKLWGVPWMPEGLAFRYSRWRGRYPKPWEKWRYSGWRGLGYFELVGALPRGGYRLLPERTTRRHRILSALGIPASLLDPYPAWLLQRR
jgi:SAM-dependent methyltransferase